MIGSGNWWLCRRVMGHYGRAGGRGDQGANLKEITSPDTEQPHSPVSSPSSAAAQFVE